MAESLIRKHGSIVSAIITADTVLDALEEYDNRTEKYLKEEFGNEYFSSELQNMDSDFRYWNKVKAELSLFQPAQRP